MSKKFRHKGPVSEEDQRLFRDSIGPIKPLRHDRVLNRPAPPVPRPVFRERDEAAVREDMLSDTFDPADLETGEELLYARPGLQNRLLKRLRRGQFAVSAECDLHGMTVPVARRALAEFLKTCRLQHQTCVRVIHGKGNGSHQRIPVLKAKVGHWLRQHDAVLAFCSARPVDGGTGAVYVLLRAQR